MTHQLHLSGIPAPASEYPFAAGHRGVGTSREAAEAINPKLGRLQGLCFDAIKSAGVVGLTADELAERVGAERWSIQPRTSELRRMGRIVDSKQRRPNVTGKRAIVWIVASEAVHDG